MIFKNLNGRNAINGRCQSYQFSRCAFSYFLFRCLAPKSKAGSRDFIMSFCFADESLVGDLFK